MENRVQMVNCEGEEEWVEYFKQKQEAQIFAKQTLIPEGFALNIDKWNPLRKDWESENVYF